MKIKTILEARYRAPKKKHPTLDDLGADFPDLPTSKIKGDFAWHLEKFWRIESQGWRRRRNPKFSKAAKEALKAAVEELSQEDHPAWSELNISDLYQLLYGNKHVSAWTFWDPIESAKIKEHPNHDPNMDYHTRSAIEREVHEERRRIWETTWKYYEDNLPLKETPVSLEATFVPKQDIAAFYEYDGHHGDRMGPYPITYFVVVWNKKGDIIKVFADNPFDNTPWSVGPGSTHDLPAARPKDLQKDLHYYKRHHHSEWSK